MSHTFKQVVVNIRIYIYIRSNKIDLLLSVTGQEIVCGMRKYILIFNFGHLQNSNAGLFKSIINKKRNYHKVRKVRFSSI